MVGTAPAQLVRDLNLLRYRDRLHMSYQIALDEPLEEIEFALTTWSLDNQRDKLEAARAKSS